MCLAVPGEILEVLDETDLLRPAKVSFGGVCKEISLAYLPKAQVGDFVLVHVGFALTQIDAAEARKVFEALDQVLEIEREISS